MGTNFYWEQKPCKTCGSKKTYHIGKSAAGWKFLFRGYSGWITRYVDWLTALAEGGYIVDEFDKVYGLEEFFCMIEHAQEESDHDHKGLWSDSEGYNFCGDEFC